MIKSSYSFNEFVTYALLSVSIIKVASRDHQSKEVGQSNEDDWNWGKYHSKSKDIFSLSCLFFNDRGYDIECNTITHAFGKLGGGACDKNSFCVCIHAENPSLDDLWRKKFQNSEDLLVEIKRNSKLSSFVHQILNEPFKTGLQNKETLRKYLTESQYNQLQVTDTCPAMKMNIDLTNIETYVNKVLLHVLKFSNKELSEIDIETNLILALDKFKDDVNKFNLLVFEIRRIQNKSIDRILRNYLTANNIQNSLEDKKGANESNGTDEGFNVAEIISKTIINKLIKKVEKYGLDNWINWLGKKLQSILPFCTTSNTKDDNVNSADFEYHPDCFKSSSQVDKNLFKTFRPVKGTWIIGTKFILRYQKDNTGNLNLIWIKNSVLISIQIVDESNFNQNWIFGTKVRINMNRTADGSTSQIWDFGSNIYQHSKQVDSTGEHSEEKWSNGHVDKESLEMYKSYMRIWCEENLFLFHNARCVIFE